MTDLSGNRVQWDDKAVELLRIRARQRRVLDDVPDYAIEQYRPKLSQGGIPSSAPFVAESELRKLADEEAGSLQDLLADSRKPRLATPSGRCYTTNPHNRTLTSTSSSFSWNEQPTGGPVLT